MSKSRPIQGCRLLAGRELHNVMEGCSERL